MELQERIHSEFIKRLNGDKKMIDFITCPICLEVYQSGERIPCKLKCQHIMCKNCAEDWLQKVSFKRFIVIVFYYKIFIAIRSSPVPNMQNALHSKRYKSN